MFIGKMSNCCLNYTNFHSYYKYHSIKSLKVYKFILAKECCHATIGPTSSAFVLYHQPQITLLSTAQHSKHFLSKFYKCFRRMQFPQLCFLLCLFKIILSMYVCLLLSSSLFHRPVMPFFISIQCCFN